MSIRILAAGLAAALYLTSSLVASAQTRLPPGAPKAPPGAELGVSPSVAPVSSQPPSGLIYKPIAPCRAFYSPALVAANSTTAFKVTGTGFASQGGPAAGCGVPAYARAVAINFTAVGALAAGRLSAYAFGTDSKSKTTLNYQQSATQTGGATVALGTDGKMTVYSSSRVKIVGDITGYYALPLHGMISSSGGLYSGSPSFISAVRNSTGSYTLTVDRDVTYCSLNTQAYSYGYEAHGYLFNNTTVSVYAFSRGAGTVVAQDDYIYVTITC